MFVIAGITGNTGSVVAKALRDAGHLVRAYARKAERAEELQALSDEVVIGDLRDTEKLARALQDAEGAYLLVPPNYGPGILAHQLEVAQSIQNALSAAQVPRTILLSSIGAEHATGTGPIVTCHHLERLCRDIPGVTFLRAAYFMENLLSMMEPAGENGRMPHFLPARASLALVGTADVGRAAAALLLQEQEPGRSVQLAGPGDMTPEEIAEAFGRVLSRSVTAWAAPTSEVTSTFTSAGVPEELAELFRELYEAAHQGKLRFEDGRVERGTTPLEDVLRKAQARKEGPSTAARRVVEDYLNGSYTGDEAQLRSAFSPSAEIIAEDQAPTTVEAFVSRLLAVPREEGRPGFPYERRILSLQAQKRSALVTATSRVQNQIFVDHLVLERQSETEDFKIIRKAFETQERP